MSWDGYLTGYLTKKPDCTDMLAAAGIFSQAGAKCAAAGDEPSAAEVTAMVSIIKDNKKGEAAVFKGAKMQQILLDNTGENEGIQKAYFKKQGGGMVVALSNTLIIYGVYEVSKNGTCKGKSKGQNQGDAATLVESLADTLKNAGS